MRIRCKAKPTGVLPTIPSPPGPVRNRSVTSQYPGLKLMLSYTPAPPPPPPPPPISVLGGVNCNPLPQCTKLSLITPRWQGGGGAVQIFRPGFCTRTKKIFAAGQFSIWNGSEPIPAAADQSSKAILRAGTQYWGRRIENLLIFGNCKSTTLYRHQWSITCQTFVAKKISL